MTNDLSSLNVPLMSGVAGFMAFMVCTAGAHMGQFDGTAALDTLGHILAPARAAASLTVDFNPGTALTQNGWIALGLLGFGLRLTR